MRLRKRVQKQSKQIKYSNPWCRQHDHNKRNCIATQNGGGAIDRDSGSEPELMQASERFHCSLFNFVLIRQVTYEFMGRDPADSDWPIMRLRSPSKMHLQLEYNLVFPSR